MQRRIHDRDHFQRVITIVEKWSVPCDLKSVARGGNISGHLHSYPVPVGYARSRFVVNLRLRLWSIGERLLSLTECIDEGNPRYLLLESSNRIPTFWKNCT